VFVFVVPADRHEDKASRSFYANGVNAMIGKLIGTNPDARPTVPPLIDL
jgi:hypothetical protein